MNRYIRKIRDVAAGKLGLDISRTDQYGLTYRLLEHDLARLVDVACPNVIDVGANKGQTIEMVQRTLRNPRIWAFEPNRELADRLRQRYAGRTVVVEHEALGASEGTDTFHHYGNDELSSFLPLSKNEENPFSSIEIDKIENVNINTIDSYCKINNIDRIDLLKVDTQGFDLEVLKGAAGMLHSSAVGVVQVEINFAPLYDGQGTAGELIDWLREKQFGLIGLYEQVRTPKTLAWATACFLPIGHA